MTYCTHQHTERKDKDAKVQKLCPRVVQESCWQETGGQVGQSERARMRERGERKKRWKIIDTGKNDVGEQERGKTRVSI